MCAKLCSLIQSNAFSVLVAGLALAAASPAATQYAIEDVGLANPVLPLHTAGGHIVDANGVRVPLHVVSWYGAESTDYVVGGLQAASLSKIIQQIRAGGFNAVRLPWSNEMYEKNPIVPSYALTANPSMQGLTAMAVFDQIVNALTNANIMVILDNHNSDAEWCCGDDGNYLWYNSRYPESNWINDWKGIVQRYAGQPLFIGVDLRNEPRGNATWGGSSNTDWHAAAERGGDAVLSVDRNLLVFVEGISYGTDLSGASRLPVNLNIANRLVYSAHDYGFFYSGLTESAWLNHITPLWGYLITGNNPQPFWLGEFGTCHTSTACVVSANNADLGYWFTLATNYIIKNDVDWSYWALNGTQSTGGGRTYGAEETYGIVNPQWNAPASTTLSSRIKELESSRTSSHVSTLQPETPGANNLCVDVLGVRTDSGAPVAQWTCNNGQNQSFEFDSSSGSFTIHPQHSGLCLDSNTPSTAQGAVQVTQNTCTGSDQQNWNVNPNSDGSFTLTSPDGKRCLDIDGASTQLKAAVITWPCNGRGNEMFKMPTY